MKLAVIETVLELLPIDGADKIEVAKIQGWHSVVKKGQFQLGEKVVFIPIDTVMQPKEWNSFLHDKNQPDKPIRIKSIRLRGCPSQGLVFPLSILPEGEYELEVDVAELLGVTKYEKLQDNSTGNQNLRAKKLGDFPTGLISKTDEDNLLSNIKVLEELKQCDYIDVTLKCDGTSFTFIHELDGAIKVCSRNLIVDDGDNEYWNMVRKYDLVNTIPSGFAIQAEIVSTAIQKNPMGVSEAQMFVFNMKDLNTGEYVPILDTLPKVPFICRLSNEIPFITSDYFQKLANEQKYGTKPAEGIVIRGYKNNKLAYSQKLHKMLSVKVINQDYKD